jgi:hypothetical protein
LSEIRPRVRPAGQARTRARAVSRSFAQFRAARALLSARRQEGSMEERTDSKKSYKSVYTIIERGEGRKPYWFRIGAAFVNGDQSLTVKLNGLPTNGQLHIRDQSDPPWEAQGAQGFGRQYDLPEVAS